MDAFWKFIEWQIKRLGSATTADDVFRICPPIEGMSAGGAEGFFGGSGGDYSVLGTLLDAGWRIVSCDADYYWCAVAPNGDKVTYVEGDLYRGNQMLPHNEAQEV